jgi:RHS repeat-associated protein
MDLFVTDVINYTGDGTTNCPNTVTNDKIICDNIYRYENTSESPNILTLNTQSDYELDINNPNRKAYAQLERINYTGYNFSGESSTFPLYFQLFKGFKDLNNDGKPEIILESISVAGGGPSNVTVYMAYNPVKERYTRINTQDFIDGVGYKQWIDLNQDGLDDILFIKILANGSKIWAAKLNTGTDLFKSDGSYNELFFENIDSDGDLESSVFLSGGNLVDYGFPSSPCPGCFSTPFRAYENRLMDVNSDGKPELLIPDASKVLWNSCRVFVVGSQNLPTKLSSQTKGLAVQTTYVPGSFMTSFGIFEDIINNNLAPQSASSVNDIAFLCSITDNQLPGRVTSEMVSGSFYSPAFRPSGGSVDVPYSGSSDHSIYGYKALEFNLVRINGENKIDVILQDTSFIADVNGSQVGDINNDGLTDFYSSIGCEWKGCISSGYNIGSVINNSALNSTYLGELANGTELKQYIDEYYAGDILKFKRDIKEKSAVAINKTQAVMPDILVSVNKPYLSSSDDTSVNWTYYPLSAGNETTGRTTDFPLYSIPDRDLGDSYVDEPGVAGDHFYFNSSMYVVSEMRQTNNYGHDAVSEYAYEEAVYNNKGRGFQGFRTIKVRSTPDEALDAKDIIVKYDTTSVSTFHQVFPLAGKLEEINVYAVDDTPLTKETYCYDGQTFDMDTKFCTTEATDFQNEDPIVYHPLIYKNSQNFESNGGSIVSESITDLSAANSYDGYGNIKNQINSIKSYLPDSKTRTETTNTSNTYYLIDTTNWWIDKLNLSTVTKSVIDTRIGTPSTGLSHTTNSRFIWNSSTQRKLLCQYTGLSTPSTSCSTPLSNNNSSRNRFGYDGYGNITNVTTSATDYANTQTSRTVDTIYTTDGYFPASISKDRFGINLITSFSYDNATGQVKKVIAPDDNSVTSTYDAFGFKISDVFKDINDIQYAPSSYSSLENCNGNCSIEQGLVSLAIGTIQSDNGLILGTPQLTYRIEQRQDGQPHVITWFDTANNPVVTKTYHTNYDATNHSNQYNYLVNITSPMGVGVIATQAFSTSPEFKSVSVPDAQGRITKKISTLEKLNQIGGNCKVVTTYVHKGTKTTINAGTTGSTCIAPTDNSNLNMSRTYDVAGKLLSTTDADTPPNTVKYWYDASGNPLILQDADGNKIKTTFDALGRKSLVNDPNMGTKNFEYNGFGEVVKQTDAESHSTYYIYDNIGRLTEQYSNVTSAFSPIVGIRSYHDTYAYDLDKLREMTRDSNLQNNECGDNCFQEHYRKVLNYDAQNRLIDETLILTNALTNPYALYGTNYTIPDITGSDNVSFTTQYYYDLYYNRLKDTVYDLKYSIEHQYTKYGALKAQNQLTYITANSTDTRELMSIKQWNDRGQEMRREFLSSSDIASETNYYPSTGQVKNIINYSVGDDETLEYEYDAWGNIANQSLQRGSTSNSEDFYYDRLHRLTSTTGASNKTYEYDQLGNIILKSDFSKQSLYGASKTKNIHHNVCGLLSSIPGPNAIYQVNLETPSSPNWFVYYGYDARGNRIKDCFNYNSYDTDYHYDYNNLLIDSRRKYNDNGYTVTNKMVFNYGINNQRYRKFESDELGGSGGISNIEITLYGNKDYEQIYTKDVFYNSPKLQQEKFYLTSYLTVTNDVDLGKKINIMQKDRLGSTTQILDEEGKVLHTKSYDAFGKPRNGDWSDMAGGLFKAKLDFNNPDGTIDLTKRGFTDHEHLDEMQLIHMNGRMYDYNNGRFLSVDPFIASPSSTQTLNPYTYVLNNPLSGTDPSGYFVKYLAAAIRIGSRYLKDINPFKRSRSEETGPSKPDWGPNGDIPSLPPSPLPIATGGSNILPNPGAGTDTSIEIETFPAVDNTGPISMEGPALDNGLSDQGILMNQEGDNSDLEGQNSEPKTFDDLVNDSTPAEGNNRNALVDLRDTTGTPENANDDFDSLKPTEVEDTPVGRIGKLEDGSKVTVRTKDSDPKSSATLENKKGEKTTKIRYKPDENK